MTEMSNFCLKQSQGLMTSAAHPYPNFPWRNKEHRTGKPRTPTPPPPHLSYISNAYLVAWERNKLLFISNKILFILPQLLLQNVSKMIGHRSTE